MQKKGRLWGYVGRFSLLHILTYSLIAVVFFLVQEALPAPGRVALEFYEPYQALGITVILGQLVRGSILALLLSPFYATLAGGDRGGMFLFGALWGLALLGSVEPRPGSIEGLIYTNTTVIEHLLVLAANSLQVILFAWLFLGWEKRSTAGGTTHE